MTRCVNISFVEPQEIKEGQTGLDPTAIFLIILGAGVLLGAYIFFQKLNTEKPTQNMAATGEPQISGSQNQAGQSGLLQQPQQQEQKQIMQDVTELQIEDTVLGTGAEATVGAQITVHYTGMLTNGQVFDSSLNRNQPFEFTLGEGRVIKGWDQGFNGMKVGGKRRLIIPSSMGYGDQGSGPIPGKATLVFDVELLGVK